MVPRIEFRWSWVYDETYHSHTIKSEEFDYESCMGKMKKFIAEIEKIWRPLENDILERISDITGLKWEENKVFCYLIKRSSLQPISDPLTIPIEFESDGDVFSLSSPRFVDMFIHELIHNLFVQNDSAMDKYFEEVFNLYPDEEFNTAIHLLVHAVHKKIFDEFFDPERLEEEFESCKYYPPYNRSWEIVKEKGEDEIIREFKRFI